MPYDFFKGYVPVKDKKCLMAFKDKKASELLTLEQAKARGDYAGILASNAVLLDIDDSGQAETMMSIVEDLQLACRVYQTSRGMHFLFLNDGLLAACGTAKKLACGITADIKIGSRNSYSILCNENIEREIIYDIYDDEEYEKIPYWALPVKSKVDLLDLKEGDGRNQTLFNYILTLQSEGMTKDQVKKTLEIANRYVLAEPLEEEELSVIMRDDAFQKQVFFKGNQFLFDKFAQFLKSEHHIKRINGQLHLYKDGVYIDGYRKLETAMVEHLPTLSRSKRHEVLAYLELLCPSSVPEAPATLIAFKNGIFDLESKLFRSFSPEIIITNQIGWDFNNNVESELVDTTFDKIACFNPEIRALLEEAVGYCFYRKAEFRKAFILTGDKHNGKSTFLTMLTELLGEHNTSAIELCDLGTRFKTTQLFGKLANIGDDIGDEFVADPAIFKKLATGNAVDVEYKGQDPFKFRNYATLMFSANEIPRIKDRTGAVLDRLLILPFDANFTPEDHDFDPHIEQKLCTEESMQYLIKLGLRGLKRLLKNKQFTSSATVQAQLEEYNMNNNPILFFFAEHRQSDFLHQPTKYAYRKYQEFCLTNSYKPMTANEFTKQCKKYFRLDIIDKRYKGEKHRVYTKAY